MPSEDKALEMAKVKMEVIMTLVNLPSTYDRRNGIPESTYDAVAQEIAAALRQAHDEAIEQAAKVVDDCGCSDKYCNQAWGRRAKEIRALMSNGGATGER